MTIFVIVLAVLLGMSFVGGGVAKLAGVAVMKADAKRFGLSYGTFRGVGALEVCGGAGLLAGLALWPLAVAAAVGLVALMVGAVVCHVRAGDPAAKTVPAAAVGALVAVLGALVVLQ
ncbi:DoxX family protein [Streptomyces sp. NPDC088354]|uniref:DoxX family protein n=1 Tax=Streptomyces sp. NPDC088354 TaxID=3365856 RepID=UPI0038135C69